MHQNKQNRSILPLHWEAQVHRTALWQQGALEGAGPAESLGRPSWPRTGKRWSQAAFWGTGSRRGRRSRSARSPSWAPPATAAGSARRTASCTNPVEQPDRGEARGGKKNKWSLTMCRAHSKTQKLFHCHLKHSCETTGDTVTCLKGSRLWVTLWLQNISTSVTAASQYNETHWLLPRLNSRLGHLKQRTTSRLDQAVVHAD